MYPTKAAIRWLIALVFVLRCNLTMQLHLGQPVQGSVTNILNEYPRQSDKIISIGPRRVKRFSSGVESEVPIPGAIVGSQANVLLPDAEVIILDKVEKPRSEFALNLERLAMFRRFNENKKSPQLTRVKPTKPPQRTRTETQPSRPQRPVQPGIRGTTFPFQQPPQTGTSSSSFQSQRPVQPASGIVFPSQRPFRTGTGRPIFQSRPSGQSGNVQAIVIRDVDLESTFNACGHSLQRCIPSFSRPNKQHSRPSPISNLGSTRHHHTIGSQTVQFPFSQNQQHRSSSNPSFSNTFTNTQRSDGHTHVHQAPPWTRNIGRPQNIPIWP